MAEPARGSVPAARGSAPARTALAGNPSDGYGGAVLAVAVEEFAADVVVTATDGPAGDVTVTPRSRLVLMAARRFARELAPDCGAVAIDWRTTVPRSVGLGGSSALVIATLRALCELRDVQLDRAAMARLALAVEVDELQIAAGLQDRVAQCFGGLTFMEFSAPEPVYEPLNPSLLPLLLIAWRATAAEPSQAVHGDLRARHAAGDQTVRDAMVELAAAARGARDALLAGDLGQLRRHVDASYDLRAQMLTLDRRHVEMVKLARASGAATNYSGSGGAIVCVCDDEPHRDAVGLALAEVGCGTAAIRT